MNTGKGVNQLTNQDGDVLLNLNYNTIDTIDGQ